jgi:hypothetical protein
VLILVAQNFLISSPGPRFKNWSTLLDESGDVFSELRIAKVQPILKSLVNLHQRYSSLDFRPHLMHDGNERNTAAPAVLCVVVVMGRFVVTQVSFSVRAF